MSRFLLISIIFLIRTTTVAYSQFEKTQEIRSPFETNQSNHSYPIKNSGKKKEFDNILDKVAKRALQNYDSVLFCYEKYREYVYIDSSQEIVSAVNINTIVNRSGVPTIFSRHKENFQSPIVSYFLSGSMYEKIDEYGFSTLMDAAFKRKNSYSSKFAGTLFRIIDDGKNYDSKSYSLNSVCAPLTKIRSMHIQYEVKDTTYNGDYCFHLIKTSKVLFTFKEEDYKDQKPEFVKFLKELTGNWSPFYLIRVETIIVNKSDYALLFCNEDRFYSNDHNEHRVFSVTDKYKKVGSYYIHTYYKYLCPRFFSLENQPAGFNDRDMYTLIVKEYEDAKIDKYKERELNIRSLQPMSADQQYDNFLDRKSTLDENTLSEWKTFRENCIPTFINPTYEIKKQSGTEKNR